MWNLDHINELSCSFILKSNCVSCTLNRSFIPGRFVTSYVESFGNFDLLSYADVPNVNLLCYIISKSHIH